MHLFRSSHYLTTVIESPSSQPKIQCLDFSKIYVYESICLPTSVVKPAFPKEVQYSAHDSTVEVSKYSVAAAFHMLETKQLACKVLAWTQGAELILQLRTGYSQDG